MLWSFTGLGMLGISFVINVVAPGTVIDRYGGLAGWFILAVCGGKTLSILSRTPRQALLMALLLSLISASAIVDPLLSDAYAHVGY
jgi:hypothetical protein